MEFAAAGRPTPLGNAARLLEVPLAISQPWGLPPLVPIKPKSALESASAYALPNSVLSAQPKSSSRRWIGADPEPVAIDGVDYALSFVFVGCADGVEASASIDPRLTVASCAALSSSLPCLPTGYSELDPGSRRALLEYIAAGRVDPAAPIAFALHLVHSFEVALFREGRHEIARQAASELDRLLKLFADDKDFRAAAKPLLEACQLLDPSVPIQPVFASAATNHAKQMSFRVRRFVGQMLTQSRYLEADTALLVVLQQPGTRLETQVAAAFPIVYHHWTENYSYRFNGGVELHPSETISMVYDFVGGENSVEIASTIPDPASAPVPPDLQRFFEECCAEVHTLQDLPIAQQTAILKGLKSKPKLRRQAAPWSLRADYEERIRKRLSGTVIAGLTGADLLGDLFEESDHPVNKQVPVQACRRLQRALDDMGVGMEPDERYGLPARIRPDTEIALFNADALPFQEPSDAFHLAQAALTLSALGTMKPFCLERLQVNEIRFRLPYRHSYSENELRRLEAGFLAMQSAKNPRELLARWPRRMKRLQRIKDIDLGFGIAFHAQADNPMVKRFARAVSLALHNRDHRVPGLLEAVEAQVALTRQVENDRARGDQTGQPGGSWRTGEALAGSNPPSSLAGPPDGLSPALAEILIALLDGPRLRKDLTEIARRWRLQLTGALEQLNQWSHRTLGGQLTRGHNPVHLNPELFDAVELIARQK